MKFQIVTYRTPKHEFIATGNKYVARCKPFPWMNDSISTAGATSAEALSQMERLIQGQLDSYGSEIKAYEVELDASEFAKKVDAIQGNVF